MRELTVEAKLENVEKVQDFVRSALEDCPLKIQMQIAIVVDEIFSNIARYAYEHEAGHTTVRVTIGKEIAIAFEDNGIEYNPLDKADPDVSLDVEERDIGGLGIFMVKNLMDSVAYSREGSHNVLTIRKRIP